MNRKILIALIISITALFPHSASAYVSPLNPAYIEHMQQQKERGAVLTQPASNAAEGQSSGYVPSPLNWSHLENKVWNVIPDESENTEEPAMKRSSNSEESLPLKYDLREGQLPPVREQKPFGNCWTHSAMASTESNLIKQGLVNTDVELSEWYLTYYAYNDGDLPGFTPNDPDEYYNEGGDDWKAVALLSRGTGSVSAATVNNVAAEEDIYAPPIVKREYRLDNAYYLGHRGQREIPSTEEGRREMLKKALMEYGALSVGMFTQSLASMSEEYGCYTGLQYGKEYPDHAVTLVGWDDTYPAGNFNSANGKTVTTPGAWIIRNSWGTERLGSGDKGYFYISYEDELLCDGVAYVTSPAPENERIYQYDELGCTFWYYPGNEENTDSDKNELADAETTVWFANIFKAAETDTIRAASLYVPDAGTTYEISVYRSCSPNEPMSGELAATVVTDSLIPGYNTVEFDTPAAVPADSLFSVVVKAVVPEGNYFSVIPIEANINEAYSGVTANYGEGFWSLDGMQFQDLMDTSLDEDEEEDGEEYASICLKAFGTGEASSQAPSGSGGGCSAGWGAAALLAVIPLIYRKSRR